MTASGGGCRELEYQAGSMGKKKEREREKHTTATDDDTEKMKKFNCKNREERCIQAVEVETTVTKPEMQERWIQIVEAGKQEESKIERRHKLNSQVAQ
eukprot:1168232-Karenia_brevis.AAC.1